ncbi:hypothetical protein GSF22_26525 [Micromonospora echinofusca]|uniref:Uncharacterized protein n=1 Tax=Micromonospora echinofusca TaxID=47858 RepID=A0ABS3VYK1_MICEH|nr:hypothetical protein [Micromonospora echinofusca]
MALCVWWHVLVQVGVFAGNPGELVAGATVAVTAMLAVALVVLRFAVPGGGTRPAGWARCHRLRAAGRPVPRSGDPDAAGRPRPRAPGWLPSAG